MDGCMNIAVGLWLYRAFACVGVGGEVCAVM